VLDPHPQVSTPSPLSTIFWVRIRTRARSAPPTSAPQASPHLRHAARYFGQASAPLLDPHFRRQPGQPGHQPPPVRQPPPPALRRRHPLRAHAPGPPARRREPLVRVVGPQQEPVLGPAARVTR
jgi:hypothetical protein